MRNKRNQAPVGAMIQRCHKWRQRRKQYIDQARQANDTIERERLLQMGEHFGRVISSEQGRIDGVREPQAGTDNGADLSDDDDADFPDFIANLK